MSDSPTGQQFNEKRRPWRLDSSPRRRRLDFAIRAAEVILILVFGVAGSVAIATNLSRPVPSPLPSGHATTCP